MTGRRKSRVRSLSPDWRGWERVWAAGIGCWRWRWQWTFDEDLALAAGVPVEGLRYCVLLAIAATVILAVKLVGVLLVTAMLILPGATGALCGRSPLAIAAVSVASSLGCLLSGLLISNQGDAPPGPVIVLLAFGLLSIAHAVRFWRDRRRAHAPTRLHRTQPEPRGAQRRI